MSGSGTAPTRLEFQSDPLAVRDELARLADLPPVSMLEDDLRATAQIVLAEVLNNIVEHAYAGTTGRIEMTLLVADGTLRCELRDYGLALPGERLPRGDLPATDAGELPEGGFGWHLIRSLTGDLAYQRRDGCNHLGFTLRPEG